MGYVDAQDLQYSLPTGRAILEGASFRVGEGVKAALLGNNGTGKTTMLRILYGLLEPHAGTVARSGHIAFMQQFIGTIRDATTVRDLLVSLAPASVRTAAHDLASSEATMATAPTSEENQMRYAQALADYADVGGYECETFWDECCQVVLGQSWDAASVRPVGALSGGEQKRLSLEALLRGPHEVVLLDEPDNALDVPGKLWLEEALRHSAKTILLVSHDREVISAVANRIITIENRTTWIHMGGYDTYEHARAARHEQLDVMRRLWDEERARLKELVRVLGVQAKQSPTMAPRLRAMKSRLARFEQDGPPEKAPSGQTLRMRLQGGRTGVKVVTCTKLALTGLTRPFSADLYYGERLAVLGSNGSGKSHLLRLLAEGGTDPDPGSVASFAGNEHVPTAHTGTCKLGARVRVAHFSQNHEHTGWAGLELKEILWQDFSDQRGPAISALGRYGLQAEEQHTFTQLSGGQQARFQVLVIEKSGANLLLLDEPTDNLDIASAEALEEALRQFDGTVVAVTHDRWFARSFERFLVFREDGSVVETAEPVWD